MFKALRPRSEGITQSSKTDRKYSKNSESMGWNRFSKSLTMFLTLEGFPHHSYQWMSKTCQMQDLMIGSFP